MVKRLPAVLALFVLVIFGNAGNAGAGDLTKAVCEADYQDLLISIERNRIAGNDQINEHLMGVTDEKERARLIDMREKSWDEEEEQRAIATNIRRDCLAAVNSKLQ